MSIKEDEIKIRTKEIKRILYDNDVVPCIGKDLLGTKYDESLYSDDLFLLRDDDDKFIHIHDNEDGTDGKVSIEDLKIIIRNIATREINDKFELEELEKFLSMEDDE